jgi:3-phosphoshikimate 1-carboxyvinyltransferase
MGFRVAQFSRLRAQVSLPGDKAIAHRAAIFSVLADGITRIKNFPFNVDCQISLRALRALGAKIKVLPSREIIISGLGLRGLKKPAGPVFLGDSGTSLRLLLGVLAGQPFSAKLTAGKSLSRRPMHRVAAPLRLMGAEIRSQVTSHKSQVEEYPPLVITGGNLKGITYKMPVASAQVKSAILLAGLNAAGQTKVIEPARSRDHTERMLKLFKAKIKTKGNIIVIDGERQLSSPGKIYIPGDISSAAFFIVAAAIIPDSVITIKNVSLNPSRCGAIRVLRRMGANIAIHHPCLAGRQAPSAIRGGEPMGDLSIETSRLRGVTVKGSEIPSLIDELPVLMVAACFARGKSVFMGVEELRVKETDRIQSMLENLSRMGAQIRLRRASGREYIEVRGTAGLKGARVKSFADHRTAMSLIVAGLAACGRTEIDEVACIKKSFPGFLGIIRNFS